MPVFRHVSVVDDRFPPKSADAQIYLILREKSRQESLQLLYRSKSAMMRPSTPLTAEMTQKRMTMVGSAQPFASK